jgi:hypothetical protein
MQSGLLSATAGLPSRGWTTTQNSRETPMPIRTFLRGQSLDQETVRPLGLAFELVCIALRTGGSDDHVKQAIANKIIDLAKDGERNPDILCERALKSIRGPEA